MATQTLSQASAASKRTVSKLDQVATGKVEIWHGKQLFDTVEVQEPLEAWIAQYNALDIGLVAKMPQK